MTSYHGYRFPLEIIIHAVWLYHRFCLSFRDVEDLLAERGVTVSHEAIRQWCQTFGLAYARTLRSYSAAHRTVMPSVVHSTRQYANNRAEVSHQPTRQRERLMRRFTSAAHAQRLLSVHGVVLNLFRLGRHLLRAVHHRLLRTRAFWVVCLNRRSESSSHRRRSLSVQPQLDCEHHSAACRGRSVTLVGAGGWWPDPQLD